ncbi:hypothetical protein FRC12_004553 [Ceratobasidium sp. 428]|nr:hypothetical protein FRC12_004553 [Ceratobasidium sp. 428]
MATDIAPVPVQLRRRVFPAGAALLAAEALDLVNLPAANNLAQHVHEWVKSLKVSYILPFSRLNRQTDTNQPRILQAPANNDQDARDLTSYIDRYVWLAETAANFISDLDAAYQNESTAKFLLQLQGFHEYLGGLRTELESLQDERLMVKLACQTDIKSRLDEKREELLDQTILFCLEIGLFANCTAAQSRQRQRSSDERLRQLECQVSALCLARRTDEQCISLHPSAFFF